MTEAGPTKIAPAELDWVADAPRSISFGDIYFSGDGPAESRHVFLDGNDLARRLASARRFVIGELGFGTGLNFLATWALQRSVAPRTSLEYLSIEKHPLRTDDLRRAHKAWPGFADLSAALRAEYPPPAPGVHRLRLEARDGQNGDCAAANLTLIFGDALASLRAAEGAVDAWFLDGFAPARNPDMWRPEIFDEIARLSAHGATAATFTVAGEVRRALRAAGFSVGKRVGFGRKREMLTAQLQDGPPRSTTISAAPDPWFHRAPLSLPPGANVAIIGAGIAGASLADALAGVGLAPTLIDPLDVAGGASGNPAALIMPRLDLGDTPAARFFRQAYFHALRTISRLGGDGGPLFNRCGALLLATDDAERTRQDKIAAAGLLPSGWIERRPEGLFFPQAGVIDPAAYCRRLAQRAELLRATAIAFEDAVDGVSVVFHGGARRRFDAAILANGRDASRFFEARTLPLKGVLGQIDWFRDAPAPPQAIAFGPYAAPAPGGGLVVGATFEPLAAGAAPHVSRRATEENIRAAARAVAVRLEAEQSTPRAAARCQTPDRLPVVGALPDWDFYGAAYDDLRVGKRRDYPPAQAAPRRYILAGLGSRGLVTGPYCAAIVAAELSGAPSPVERDVAHALHPARFFIRDLRGARVKPSRGNRG
jgi:tRNA 5-methylaminomethyl-2-thiouridine biosynthesis bifunctional protein